MHLNGALRQIELARNLLVRQSFNYQKYNLALASAEAFDPVRGAWAPLAPMNDARNGHTATLLADGRVLVAGGELISKVEVFDPTMGKWTRAKDMSVARAVVIWARQLSVARARSRLWSPSI